MYSSGQTSALLQFDAKLTYPHLEYIRHFNLFGYFLLEAFATFFLILVIYSTMINNTRPKTEIYGILIGGTYTFIILTIGTFTGAALNPARILGPCIVSGELFSGDYNYFWIYILGPFTGAMAAAVLWRLVYAYGDD